MTVVVVVLAVALAGAIAAITYLGVRVYSSVAAERQLIETMLATGKAQLVIERELQKITGERDAALQSAREHELAAAKAIRAFSSCRMQLDELLKKEGDHVVTKIRAAATADDALAVLRDLMSSPLPGFASADAAGGDTAPAEVDRSEAGDRLL